MAETLDKWDVWREAERIMNGEGASTRSASQANPVMHILTENDEMWCSGGRAMPFVPLRHRLCSTCLALAREMHDDLSDEGDI